MEVEPLTYRLACFMKQITDNQINQLVKMRNEEFEKLKRTMREEKRKKILSINKRTSVRGTTFKNAFLVHLNSESDTPIDEEDEKTTEQKKNRGSKAFSKAAKFILNNRGRMGCVKGGILLS